MDTRREDVLIVGVTGTVGREVLRASLARGLSVRALVRRLDRAPPELSAHEVVEGDLGDLACVERALSGCRAAFYVSPHEEREAALGLQFAEACARAGVRLVFLGSHIDAPTRALRWVLRAVMGQLLPRYRAKFGLSERVRQRCPDAVLLVPTHFFQNDEYPVVIEQLHQQGRYIQPIGRKGMNRIDARDIGEIVARLLDDPAPTPGALAIVGPEVLTGEQCAAAWADALGRTIRYEAVPEIYDAGIREAFSRTKAEDILQTYPTFEKLGIPSSARALEATQKLLGRPPTSYAAYVRRLAAG